MQYPRCESIGGCCLGGSFHCGFVHAVAVVGVAQGQDHKGGTQGQRQFHSTQSQYSSFMCSNYLFERCLIMRLRIVSMCEWGGIDIFAEFRRYCASYADPHHFSFTVRFNFFTQGVFPMKMHSAFTADFRAVKA